MNTFRAFSVIPVRDWGGGGLGEGFVGYLTFQIVLFQILHCGDETIKYTYLKSKINTFFSVTQKPDVHVFTEELCLEQRVELY